MATQGLKGLNYCSWFARTAGATQIPQKRIVRFPSAGLTEILIAVHTQQG